MSDEGVVTAMLDRLLHHELVYNLKGDSCRMKAQLRVGVVGFDRWHGKRRNKTGEKQKMKPAFTSPWRE
jgi:hypothetical protein